MNLLLVVLVSCFVAPGDTPPPAGHSLHGETFNEGPRQKAVLLGGTGKVHLEVTSRVPDVQAFVDQGVGQLHGFWYFEAERSFRQAAALDPDCAMAYWGMAMANVNNPKRAQGFIQRAIETRSKASRREQLWIDAYAAYWTGKKDDKERRQDLIRALEDLSYEFPNEVEAKAFLCFHLWDSSGRGVPITSKQAVDALMREVLDVQPMHPVHHYRIHLWDSGDKAKRALDSAANCGQSAPGIAHMWHMSGHIFVDLKRYSDAAWQQEASARVDHGYMMQYRVLPDQIHNYAHNNQWLVEDYEFIGRVHDAVALAKNLIELPRHPRYNMLGLKDDGSRNSFGSSQYGRQRLIETLIRYELWDELIALANSMYLEPTELPPEQVKRLRVLGMAHFARGDAAKGREQIRELETRLQKLRTDRIAAAEQAETKARQEKKPADQINKAITDALVKGGESMTPIDTALAELRGYDLLARGDREKAAAEFDKATDIPKEHLARVWLKVGDAVRAVKLAREAVVGGDKQVYRLASCADVLNRAAHAEELRPAGTPGSSRFGDLIWRGAQAVEAERQFEKLRALSAEIDLDVPVMKRLAPLARAMKLPADWRIARFTPPDAGVRPNLDTLGPLCWEPSPAPDFVLPGEKEQKVALAEFRGRPVIVIFFLGSGCPHCIEQLNAFEPMVEEYRKAGISLVAISTDSVEGLRATFAKSKLPERIPLVSDHELKVFKAYRAFDDFEKQPLHGTFLIDGNGRVRWQDVSYEPFRDVKFLLAESKRLLALPPELHTRARSGWFATGE